MLCALSRHARVWVVFGVGLFDGRVEFEGRVGVSEEGGGGARESDSTYIRFSLDIKHIVVYSNLWCSCFVVPCLARFILRPLV